MRALLLFALAAVSAAAQAPEEPEPRRVPEGYVQVETVGKVRIWAPTREALGSGTRIALKAALGAHVHELQPRH